jgi:hypothetical protein
MVMIISKFLSFETPNLLCKRLPNYRLKPVVVDTFPKTTDWGIL